MRKEKNGTEAKVLDAAKRMFNDWGYSGMTLRQVAKEVGIEVQSLYNYTPSKQALVERIIRIGTEELRSSVLTALEKAPDNPRDRLYAATRAHVVHYAGSSNVVVFFRNSLIHFDDETRASLRTLMDGYEQIFKQIIRGGIDSGDFRDVEVTPTTYAMLGMGESITNWWQPAGKLSAEELGELYADLALRMVANPDTPQNT